MAPATITIDADASDADATVTTVEFFRGGSTPIGAPDATSPYSVTWSNVGAGTYALTARANDNDGAMTVSGTIFVVVSDPATPHRALFAPSTNHNTAVDRYELEIFPEGANPSAANRVGFQNLGKPAVVSGECEADVRQTIANLPSGRYIATVTACGSGGSARSAQSLTFIR